MNLETLTMGWIVTALLLGLSLVPVAVAIGRAQPRLRRLALSVPPVAFLAVTAVAVLKPPHLSEEQRITERPVEVQSEGYVTSRACEACHPGNYATWYGSYHRSMTRIASPESVAANVQSARFEYGRYHYTITRRDDRFWVGSDDPAWAAAAEPLPADEDTRPFIERPLVMVTGSHHEQVYWLSLGSRRLGMFPILYLIGEDRWAPYSGVFLIPSASPPAFVTGRWNKSCIRCHATNPRPGVWSESRMDTQVSELGIACEACHGPGREHVEANHDPERRYRLHFGDGPDPTVVNPERLSARRSTEVCGSCHSVHSPRSAKEDREVARNGFPYRPGDELEKTRHILRVADGPLTAETQWVVDELPHILEDSFWPDGMPSVTGREYNGITSSPCYAGEQFSCLSCHQLHKRADDERPLSEWADDQLGVGMRGDRACLQCHTSFGDDIAAHTHHPTASEGSRCYNCHMPNTAYGLLKGSRSHQITVPTARETLEVARPNACNLCHLDRTLAWTGEHLRSWYGTPVPDWSDPERERTADGALMLLRGDAAQRALVAWHMGWAPAREASGEEWLAPMLAQLLEDPYGAVRSIAIRSLKTLPGYADIEYDVFGSEQDHRAAKWKVWEIWERSRTGASRPNSSEILMRANGGIETSRFDRLLSQRDDRRIFRNE